MADQRKLEFLVLRYVPDVVKEEFVNIGLVLFEPGANGNGFSDVRFTRDWRRVYCLDSQVDVEWLEAMERDIRSQVADLHDREALLHKLTHSFSNTVQVTASKACVTRDPRAEIEKLAKLYLDGPKPGRPRVISARGYILERMQDEFVKAGVWGMIKHGVPVSAYTKPGDTFEFDFGYEVGRNMKLFHAVSLKTSVDAAVMLAARYPDIASGMAKATHKSPLLTAVINDGLDRKEAEIGFALGMLEDAKIRTAPLAEMPAIAELARQELRA